MVRTAYQGWVKTEYLLMVSTEYQGWGSTENHGEPMMGEHECQ